LCTLARPARGGRMHCTGEEDAPWVLLNRQPWVRAARRAGRAPASTARLALGAPNSDAPGAAGVQPSGRLDLTTAFGRPRPGQGLQGATTSPGLSGCHSPTRASGVPQARDELAQAASAARRARDSAKHAASAIMGAGHGSYDYLPYFYRSVPRARDAACDPGACAAPWAPLHRASCRLLSPALQQPWPGGRARGSMRARHCPAWGPGVPALRGGDAQPACPAYAPSYSRDLPP